jgi:hypothetical protein
MPHADRMEQVGNGIACHDDCYEDPLIHRVRLYPFHMVAVLDFVLVAIIAVLAWSAGRNCANASEQSTNMLSSIIQTANPQKTT